MGNGEQLLIIGYGNMSGAMLAGWLRAGGDPASFTVLNRSPKPVPDGVVQYDSAEAAAEAGTHNAVLLGFKPHQLALAAPDFQALTRGKCVYSLLGGMTLAQIEGAFPQAAAHVRVMPNLACRINKSPVLLIENGMDDAMRRAAFALFDTLGNAVWLADESRYNLATALAGSGPGFVYRFIDALAGAGARLGLEPDQAQQLALAMVDGAAALAAQADISPAQLADRVASKGGMTRAGLNVLDADQALEELLMQTLLATSNRGAEMSEGR